MQHQQQSLTVKKHVRLPRLRQILIWQQKMLKQYVILNDTYKRTGNENFKRTNKFEAKWAAITEIGNIVIYFIAVEGFLLFLVGLFNLNN